MTVLGAAFFEAVADKPLAIEAGGLEAGEPFIVHHVAGLQFYAYDMPNGVGGRVRPEVGDRLALVRRPDNRADQNAIEIWWRNDHRIGHVPRNLAATIAPRLDAGMSCRAYVGHAGNGEAWSMKGLLVGEAVAPIYDAILQKEADEAWRDLDSESRNQDPRHLADIRRNAIDEIWREERMRDAAETLFGVPFTFGFNEELPF